jgi:hypothetical protein
LLNLRAGSDAQIVLPVDQLEQLCRLTSQKETLAFLAGVNEAISSPDAPLVMLITLRADFVGSILQFPDLARSLQDNTLLLGAMDRSALRQVICGPARVAGLDFNDALVDEILDDTAGGDALPLLADVLEQLWTATAASGDPKVRQKAYRDLGGVKRALALRAEALFEQTPEADKRPLLEALIELADIDDIGQFTRRRRRFVDLPSAARPALERFIDARLAIASANEDDEPMVEVVHEALLRNWPLLHGWLVAESERLRLRKDIARDADDWESHKRSDAYLWRGERLVAAIIDTCISNVLLEA